MAVDYTKIQMISKASSNKVVADDTGGFTIAGLGGAGEQNTTVTIPHGQGTTNIIPQVTVSVSGITNAVIPWQSNDGRLFFYVRWDSTNLYIVGNSNSSGGAVPSRSVTYHYKILVP